MSPSSRGQTRVWDRLGIGASFVCLLHCLALPLLLVTGGTVWAAWDVFHIWLALLLIPVVLLAARSGYRAHGRSRVMVLLGVGLITILTAVVLDFWLGKFFVSVISMIGGVFLIVGHWRNLVLGTTAARAHEHA